MKLSKHAYARFKQRQKIKNREEMYRKFTLALERGIPLVDESNQRGTLCYLFDGYKYIVSGNNEILITVFPAKKPSEVSRRYLIGEIRRRQYDEDVVRYR